MAVILIIGKNTNGNDVANNDNARLNVYIYGFNRMEVIANTWRNSDTVNITLKCNCGGAGIGRFNIMIM